MVKYEILSILTIFLFLIPSAFAQVTPSTTNIILQQNSDSSIKVPCFNSTNSPCISTVKCNLTLNYPDSSILVNNKAMTNINGIFNISLNKSQTSLAGIYNGVIRCNSPGQGSGFSNAQVIINRDGIDLSGDITAIILVGLILLALLIFFIVMAIMLEQNLKLIFASLAFITLPITLFVASRIVANALLPISIINLVDFGYILSLYLLGTFILYVMYKLTMGLKIQDNAKEGAQTSGTMVSKKGKKEKLKAEYEEDDDTFKED